MVLSFSVLPLARPAATEHELATLPLDHSLCCWRGDWVTGQVPHVRIDLFFPLCYSFHPQTGPRLPESCLVSETAIATTSLFSSGFIFLSLLLFFFLPSSPHTFLYLPSFFNLLHSSCSASCTSGDYIRDGSKAAKMEGSSKITWADYKVSVGDSPGHDPSDVAVVSQIGKDLRWPKRAIPSFHYGRTSILPSTNFHPSILPSIDFHPSIILDFNPGASVLPNFSTSKVPPFDSRTLLMNAHAQMISRVDLLIRQYYSEGYEYRLWRDFSTSSME